jgi:hypothetical protein
MKPITHQVQRANDASPVKQTRIKNVLQKGKNLVNRNSESQGPDFGKAETFNDYKSMASTFTDFNNNTDTAFTHTSLDPGAAERGTNHFARVSASKGSSSAFPAEQKMYRTTNESGQDLYTSVKKYKKK